MTGCNREKTCSACCVSICPLIEAICVRFVEREVGERVVQARRTLGIQFQSCGRCRRDWRLHRADRPQGRTVASSAASRLNSLPPTVLNRRFMLPEVIFVTRRLLRPSRSLHQTPSVGNLRVFGSVRETAWDGRCDAHGRRNRDRWAYKRHAWLCAFSAGREPRRGLVVGRGVHKHEQYGRRVGSGCCRRAGRSRVAWSV